MVAFVEPNQQYNKTETSDKEYQITNLAKAARIGDRESFEKLVTLFQERIFQMVYYRTFSQMDAEDLTQEIFLKAFRSVQSLKDTNYFKSWLFKIAVNRVRDFKRKRQIFAFIGIDNREQGYEEVKREIYDPPWTDSNLMKQEFWECLGLFVKKLSHWEREVFLLRFFDELGIRDAQII
ncbi:MAG: RNA polymerase sigma factor [Thermodesulfobacteriota bacterium]|nr:RNA polymerase sigma factor [Thermodesulfobacteriota bacterium]